ncbi:MAG: PaaX family transcriptional regulator [Streptosporangiales bacterium]|nr:PaaX family transcriptional regulator [Streptosporangiales bacterium]
MDPAGGDTGRVTRSGHPPRLLLTLLGDYWWRRTAHLPSAALVALLGEFAVSDASARAALSRLVKHGLLIRSKHGRHTFHGLSDRAAQILDDGARRIFSFGRTTQPWDGVWTLVAFSVPEHNRRARYALRERLRWLGFGPLYDGLWVSPRSHAAEVMTQLTELGIADTGTVFRARTMPPADGRTLSHRAWDLDYLRGEYKRFTAFAEQLHERTLAGVVSPVEALVARTQVMDHWRAFPAMDPELPDELLPGDWPRGRAQQLFIATYDSLGPAAAHRVRQIIGRYAPELATQATHHNSDAHLFPSQGAAQAAPQ